MIIYYGCFITSIHKYTWRREPNFIIQRNLRTVYTTQRRVPVIIFEEKCSDGHSRVDYGLH